MPHKIMKITILTLLLPPCIFKFIPKLVEAQSQFNWDHNHFSPLSNTSPLETNDPTQQKHPKALVIQSLPPGPEEVLLSITSRVNRAYAKRLGFDYLSYVGEETNSYLLTELFLKRIKTSNNNANENEQPNYRDYFQDKRSNEFAVADGFTDSSIPPHYYDAVVILESDAIIVQLDFNIVNLLQSSSLVASGVDKSTLTKDGMWSVYSNVMIWNLCHPLFYNTTRSWLRLDGVDVEQEEADSDGGCAMCGLVKVLMDMSQSDEISDVDLLQEIPREMVNGLEGTVIKQDRDIEMNRIITEKDLPRMIPIIQGIADNVCYRYYPQCEII
jgi:hypothetical protein